MLGPVSTKGAGQHRPCRVGGELSDSHAVIPALAMRKLHFAQPPYLTTAHLFSLEDLGSLWHE